MAASLGKPVNLWVIEVPGVADLIGAAGFGVQTFESDFTPCTEIGWRFASEYWGRGYATEVSEAVLACGFGTLAMDEIYSMSSKLNKRSWALMERIGLRFLKDFEWPQLPQDHPLHPAVSHRLTHAEWIKSHPPTPAMNNSG